MSSIASDFGLATELKDSKKASKDGLYKLTEMTGSPVYMAPEGKELCTVATRKWQDLFFKKDVVVFTSTEIP